MQKSQGPWQWGPGLVPAERTPVAGKYFPAPCGVDRHTRAPCGVEGHTRWARAGLGARQSPVGRSPVAGKRSPARCAVAKILCLVVQSSTSRVACCRLRLLPGCAAGGRSGARCSSPAGKSGAPIGSFWVAAQRLQTLKVCQPLSLCAGHFQPFILRNGSTNFVDGAVFNICSPFHRSF